MWSCDIDGAIERDVCTYKVETVCLPVFLICLIHILYILGVHRVGVTLCLYSS